MKEISYKEAIDFLLPLHYSGRKPTISFAFGYYEEGVLKAVCTFGKPASHSLCIGVCGEEYSDKVFELNRLCVNGEIKIQLSKFVSWCLNQLKHLNLIIVSYADTQMNHCGYIYQATNWIYTGKTKRRTDKHSRHYDRDAIELVRKVRSAKHRYIYFCCNKVSKKVYLKKLKYDIFPYPKEENKRYRIGDFIKQELIYLDN